MSTSWTGLLILLLLGGVASGSESIYSPGEMDRTILEYIVVQSEDTLIERKTDRSASLASFIAPLSPSEFNYVIGFCLADYRQNFSHREPLEQLFLAVTENELYKAERLRLGRPAVLKVIDDVLLVWTAAYAFGFGKGIVNARGSGLMGLARFQNAVRSMGQSLPKGWRVAMGLTAAGGAAGVSEVVHDALKILKIDVRASLSEIQAASIEDLTRELRALNEPKSNSPVRRSELQAEAERLYAAAPQHRRLLKTTSGLLREAAEEVTGP